MLSTQDKTRIDDTRIASVRPLMTPALLEERLPALPAHLALVERSRQDISNVLQGQDELGGLTRSFAQMTQQHLPIN